MGAKHTPGPMRPVTAVEKAAGAAEHWRSQYRHWADDNKFADGRTKGEVDDLLDRHQHSPENIAAIINDGWAYPDCSCCGGRFEAVAMTTSSWGDETWSLCIGCLEHAASMLRQLPNGPAKAEDRK